MPEDATFYFWENYSFKICMPGIACHEFAQQIEMDSI